MRGSLLPVPGGQIPARRPSSPLRFKGRHGNARCGFGIENAAGAGVHQRLHNRLGVRGQGDNGASAPASGQLCAEGAGLQGGTDQPVVFGAGAPQVALDVVVFDHQFSKPFPVSGEEGAFAHTGQVGNPEVASHHFPVPLQPALPDGAVHCSRASLYSGVSQQEGEVIDMGCKAVPGVA